MVRRFVKGLEGERFEPGFSVPDPCGDRSPRRGADHSPRRWDGDAPKQGPARRRGRERERPGATERQGDTRRGRGAQALRPVSRGGGGGGRRPRARGGRGERGRPPGRAGAEERPAGGRCLRRFGPVGGGGAAVTAILMGLVGAIL